MDVQAYVVHDVVAVIEDMEENDRNSFEMDVVFKVNELLLIFTNHSIKNVIRKIVEHNEKNNEVLEVLGMVMDVVAQAKTVVDDVLDSQISKMVGIDETVETNIYVEKEVLVQDGVNNYLRGNEGGRILKSGRRDRRSRSRN